ncbi:hypothetical protein ASESINO_246 [Erwinia phage vB_EamM_Asesino]|uniref:Uncharacterized protein n=1 Tax=Erwinia phage vB_EamM_Asesino TaxID=1883370 RepID=A0A1B2IAF1_9CAUD|nr:hypothetical protein ASESINO_246 [Erwinia phage vB_EamM_Asesino]ANZ48259.1 hypothetical protein ASESINO_246 [Erwinia phage vB_EamM_Asesino]
MTNDKTTFLRAALDAVSKANVPINQMATMYGFSLTGEPSIGAPVSHVVLSPDEKDAFVRYLRSLGYRCHLKDFVPSTDGLNHYNIYSQARTLLGKMASNFYSQPEGKYFDTVDGRFLTLEGYYHYLRILDYAMYTYCRDIEPAPLLTTDNMATAVMREMVARFPDIRKLAKYEGADCIRIGRSLKAAIYGGTDYRPGAFSAFSAHRFMTAMVFKLHTLTIDGVSLGNILSAQVHAGVPLLHYYVMNGRQINPPHSDWLPGVVAQIVQHIDPYGETFDPHAVIQQIGNDDGSV